MICHEMLPDKLRKIYLTKITFSQHTMNILTTRSITKEGIAGKKQPVIKIMEAGRKVNSGGAGNQDLALMRANKD
jgi:hypothetical protein